MQIRTSLPPKGSRKKSGDACDRKAPLNSLPQHIYANQDKYARRGQGGDRKAPLNSLTQHIYANQDKFAAEGVKGATGKPPLKSLPMFSLKMNAFPNPFTVHISMSDLLCSYLGGFALADFVCFSSEPLRNAHLHSKFVLQLSRGLCARPRTPSQCTSP